MKKITILGAGMVGRAMAADLCKDYQILSVDRDLNALGTLKSYPNIQVAQADLSIKESVQKIIQDADLVIGAVPGFMGFETMKIVIESKKNTVDIAFYPENPFLLNELAKEKNVTAIMDCGVAPGMSNMILGYHAQQMKVDFFECLVGGLPLHRTWPYEYKAPFSPIDVLEEYVRPARFVENGRIVTRPALSDRELVHFEEVGTLEAFNTDGLRTLIATMKQIPFMKEKTMRYPGHCQLMEVIRESGFLREESSVNCGRYQKELDIDNFKTEGTTRIVMCAN